MRIAIHQPHYFPWVGYFDKMAKVDAFVLLDEVQFEKGSAMIRNRVLDAAGEIRYITISGDTSDFLNKKYSDHPVKDGKKCFEKQLNMLKNYYHRAPYKKEILPILEEFLGKEYETVCQCTCSSISLIRDILKIETPLIYQSTIDYDRERKRSDLVYAICESLGADTYLSGRGASMRYLKRDEFRGAGVDIAFQDFSHPVYRQLHRGDFIPGVSVLDMLFNCGIEETKNIFWDNVSKRDASAE